MTLFKAAPSLSAPPWSAVARHRFVKGEVFARPFLADVATNHPTRACVQLESLAVTKRRRATALQGVALAAGSNVTKKSSGKENLVSV